MKQYFINLLSKYLFAKNFLFEKKSLRFYRIEKERTLSIRLVFIRDVSVFMIYEIRFNEIERIVNLFYDKKSAPLSPTIFIDTGNLLVETELYKFSIQDSKYVEEAVVKIIYLAEKFAFEYFDRYKNHEDLFDLLNEIPYQPMKIRNSKYHNEPVSGFFRGLSAAKLLNRNITAVVQEHRGYLKTNGYSVSDMDNYERFVFWLDKAYDVDC